MTCTVRALLPIDLPAYKALRDEALRAAPDAFTSDYESSVGRPAQVYASRLGTPESGHFVLGAFDESGALLGSIAVEREQRIKAQHCALVVGMMVAPAAQRRGIATQLIAKCLLFTSENHHLEQLILTVTATNLHVVQMYERAGFVRYGLLPGAIKVDGVYYDKLQMRLDLQALRAAEKSKWPALILY
jgi:RimJ/RimL family protein N-acetyltransferase